MHNRQDTDSSEGSSSSVPFSLQSVCIDAESLITQQHLVRELCYALRDIENHDYSVEFDGGGLRPMTMAMIAMSEENPNQTVYQYIVPEEVYAGRDGEVTYIYFARYWSSDRSSAQKLHIHRWVTRWGGGEYVRTVDPGRWQELLDDQYGDGDEMNCKSCSVF